MIKKTKHSLILSCLLLFISIITVPAVSPSNDAPGCFISPKGSTPTVCAWPSGSTHTGLNQSLMPAATQTTQTDSTPEIYRKSQPVIHWTDKKLAEFLSCGNHTEAVLIEALTVSHAGQMLQLYDHIENEERRAQRGQRPILARAQPKGPFVRGIDFVARVDRSRDLVIKLKIKLIQRLHPHHPRVSKRPVKKLFAYTIPGEEEEITLTDRAGNYIFEIEAQKHCAQVRFQIRSGDERHEVIIHFSNRKKPVTLVK